MDVKDKERPGQRGCELIGSRVTYQLFRSFDDPTVTPRGCPELQAAVMGLSVDEVDGN